MELLERDHLLAQLSGLLDRAQCGQGACVFIGGEAGVGKTSLVRQFVDARPAGVGALWGISDALQTPSPLAALHDMISQLESSTRARLVNAADRTELFPAFFAAVSSQATVLVFEDVHWADEATMDLLRYLGRRVSRTRLLLMATYRDDQIGPEHPLRIVLGDLATAGIQRMSVAPLSAAGVRTLAGSHAIDSQVLHERTGGNPFFVTEVLASAGSAIPPTVRDAVLARVLRTTLAARQVLGLVAIVPGHTERWLVQEVLPGSADALEQCLQDGLLMATEGTAEPVECSRATGSVQFRHEIARQAMEEYLPASAAAQLHSRVLEVLEARAPDALARLVHHAVGAGASAALVRHAPPAARQAARSGAHREAASHYARALSSRAVPDEATRAEWLEAQAYELYLVSEIRAAVGCRLEALRIWRAQGAGIAQGRNLRWLSRLQWMLGDKGAADHYGEQAIRELERSPPGAELAMAYSNLAQLHMLAEKADEAIFWGGRAIALAEECGAGEVLVHALNNVGNAKAFADDASGLVELERSLRLALEGGYEEHAARTYCNLASGAVVQREYARALPLIEEGIAFSSDRGLESWSVYLTAWRSRTHFEQGRWDEAAADAREVLGRIGLGVIWRIPAMTVLAALSVRRGDPGSAELLDEVQRVTLPTGELQRIWPVAVARAEAAWLAGDLTRCRDEAAVGFAIACQRHNRWASGETAFWLWRADALENRPEPCAEPYALQMRGDWSAAAAAWEAQGCPYERAGALADGDEAAQREALLIYEQLGAQPAASRLRERMRAQGLRGISRGKRPSTRSNSCGLTAREVEVLALLEQGLSNARIAETVHRSVRTIDHHVAAILDKLEAGSRGEAVVHARQRGLLSPR